jgi:hypothetical protein
MNYDSSYYSDDINPFEDLIKIPVFTVLKYKPTSLFYDKQKINFSFISNVLKPSKQPNLKQCVPSER